jgi:nicotinamidase-related amidase
MSSLKEQLQKVFAFFKTKPAIKYDGDAALLVIDVQKTYCQPRWFFGRGNAETKKVSERIKSLVPEFRKAGIPVYVIYFGEEKKKASQVDFYKFTPQGEDVLVAKNRDSAFEGSNIKEILKKDKRKLLLTCGFNLNACVLATVLDARDNGFDVTVLRDMSGNDNEAAPHRAEEFLTLMRGNGVTIEESDKVLEVIRAKKNNSSFGRG